MIDGDEVCFILTLVFVGTFKLLGLGVVIRCADFGVERFSNSGEGIGINASLLIGDGSFWDVSEITDGDDETIYMKE